MSSEDQSAEPVNLETVREMAERMREAVRRMQHDHPRHYVIFCNAKDFDQLDAGIKGLVLDEATTVEVKIHSYAKAGQCYLMRHPDDFLAWGPASRMVIPMGGAEPGEPWFSASSA